MNRHRRPWNSDGCHRCGRPDGRFQRRASSDSAAGMRRAFRLCRHCAASLAGFLGRQIAEPYDDSQLPAIWAAIPPWEEIPEGATS